MRNIVINDIEMIEDLDKETAAGITGGWWIQKALVKLSYEAGKVIGTELDEQTGASDDLSDAAINTIGPAPKWLQSWF
jgi:hypothetical protein